MQRSRLKVLQCISALVGLLVLAWPFAFGQLQLEGNHTRNSVITWTAEIGPGHEQAVRQALLAAFKETPGVQVFGKGPMAQYRWPARSGAADGGSQRQYTLMTMYPGSPDGGRSMVQLKGIFFVDGEKAHIDDEAQARFTALVEACRRGAATLLLSSQPIKIE